MKDRDRDSDQDGGDDMSLSECASSTANKGKQETLEESSRLVKTLLERVEQVNVELLGFVNILTDTVEDNHFQESLNDVRLA